ncbi:MAG: 23S rRNA (uracil(1939)-C(5))-methyltransferase RlmD [Paludibacteraceae bacterium]|nr:23S rRNA (uracil(1939)-C(5))-methyltransferase RlmD [Paludibacteraceae bacterium]
MGRRNLPILEDIEITGIAAEGKALARVDDIVCFVPYCVPGDIVDLQVTKKKHSFMEARVLRYKKLSSTRCEAVCQHYGLCGGCKWQILPYEEQLRWKQRQVEDNLTRIGKIELPPISPILGSKKIYEYRNKLEFAFADHKWLTTEQMKSGIPFEPGVGFHIPNNFDKVLQIDTCHLMEGLQNDIRNGVYAFAREHGMTFYNEHSHTGMLRNLMIRNNNEGEWMVVVVFGEPMDENARGLMEYLHQSFDAIICLMYCVNQKMNDTISDQDILLYAGQDHIMEKMEDLQFKVGPKSFYQTNTDQAYELYSVVRKFANCEIQDGQTVNGTWSHGKCIYDLYTGTGTIANFVARQAQKVVGIEYVPEAIEDAKVNAQLNQLDNTEFFAGDMKDVLNADFIATHGQPDVIITDPPRAGMHEDVIKVILEAAPQRIVYVSCNPATQARDLALLDSNYKVIAVQPVDMFPHTQHVENVVLMENRRIGESGSW